MVFRHAEKPLRLPEKSHGRTLSLRPTQGTREEHSGQTCVVVVSFFRLVFPFFFFFRGNKTIYPHARRRKVDANRPQVYRECEMRRAHHNLRNEQDDRASLDIKRCAQAARFTHFTNKRNTRLSLTREGIHTCLSLMQG